MKIRFGIFILGMSLIALCLSAFAGEPASPKPARFVVSVEALNALAKQSLPEDIMTKLTTLKDRSYALEAEVLADLESTLGKEATQQYVFQIVTAIYRYPAEGRREPFKAPFDIETPVPPTTLLPGQLCPPPLGMFEVNQLKVIGIVLGQPGDRAKVLAPDGKSYTLMTGTCIGKFDGKVVTFNENCILIRETKQYEKGKEIIKEETDTPLCLNPAE